MSWHFVTGRLAEPALRRLLADVGARQPLEYTIGVMPITVAALMTPQWLARHLAPPPGTTRILLPGGCQGDLDPLARQLGLPIQRGPKDLRQLPEFLGDRGHRADYGAHCIEILAEINHAPRWPLPELLAEARQLARDGADLIDLGCDPGSTWSGAGECVRRLRDEGLRVSIDSFNPREVEGAVQAGAELVLSVNSGNCRQAADWGCEVVVIPDDPKSLAGFDETIAYLQERQVPLRLDPILEPIGFGFADSLQRYWHVRRQYPAARMMMGIGNLTELTDCDSAGVNLLLLGFCEECRIESVLTTQVINWARSSVRECAIGRQLVHHAVAQGVPPKNLDPRLVSLRDPRLWEFSEDELAQLAARIRDRNYRIFVRQGRIHLIAADLHLTDTDVFALFDQLSRSGPAGEPPANLSLSHAFYLGYELSKAVTAVTLGKNYQQDAALQWGHLTVEEVSHRQRKQPED